MIMNETTTCWKRFEQTLTSETDYANPLQEVRLDALFTAPSGKQYRVPGFWDGGREWRIRFIPDEIGKWQVVTDCSHTQNVGLHGVSNHFSCTEADTATRFDKHGVIRLSENRRYLTHADGTPFFWLADTAWNGPLCSTDDEWEHYLGERVRQKFTAVQWVATQWISAPNGDINGDLLFTGYEQIAVNPRAFQRLDARLNTMNSVGLLGAPVLLWAAIWGVPEIMACNPGTSLPENQAAMLARYMVARWQGNHVLWILSGDSDYSGARSERWKRIARYAFAGIKNALVTVHPMGMHIPYDEFEHEVWWNVVGYQSCHFGDSRSLSWLVKGPPATEWKREPARPFINLEPPYEMHNDLSTLDLSGVTDHEFTAKDIESQRPHRFDDHEVRRAMYWSLLVSPTAGVTYGGNGVWGWDLGGTHPKAHPFAGRTDSWQVALHMPAAEQMSHLFDFFTRIKWWELFPAPALVVKQPGEQDVQHFVTASKSAVGDSAVVYLPHECHITLTKDQLHPDIQAVWFNPRTGEYSLAVSADSRSFTTPAEGDWLLLFAVP
jgi:hypothetical protein